MFQVEKAKNQQLLGRYILIDLCPAETYGVKENGMYHGSQKQPGKSYQELADALGEGMIVKHKKFGEGVVVDMEGDHIRIQFGDNVKNMDLKVLARLGMLEIQENVNPKMQRYNLRKLYKNKNDQQSKTVLTVGLF